MPNDLDYVKHMMPPHRDHAWSGFGDLVAEPVCREPQVADGFTEHLDCYAAAAERSSGAAFWMRDDRGFHYLAAYDHRCYLVGLAAIAVGLAVMLAVGAYLVHGGWPRHAASHIAINDADDSWRSWGAVRGSPAPAWCTGFDGLSCKQQDTARE